MKPVIKFTSLLILARLILIGAQDLNITNDYPEEHDGPWEDDCPLNNFSVRAFINDFTPDVSHQISLNITWDNYLNDTNNFSLDIKSSTVNCYELNSLSDTFNGTVKFIIKPPLDMESDVTIKPKCVYTICLKFEEDNRSCKLNYTIPDCVGVKNGTRICDCGLLSPKVNISSISPGPSNWFDIEWASETSDDDYMDITDIKFIYISQEDGYALKDITQVDSTENQFGLKKSRVEMKNIPRDAKYLMNGSFQNKYGCTSSVFYTFTVPQDNNIRWILISIGSVLLMILKYQMIARLYRRYSRRRNKTAQNLQEIPELYPLQSFPHIRMADNSKYIPADYLIGDESDEYEISRQKIFLKEYLGGGEFGTVWSAKIFQVHDLVAVKKVKEPCSEETIKDFTAEIEVFKKVGVHPNIVQMIGCCTRDQPFMIVMELVPCGNLRDYLVELRDKFNRRNRYDSGIYIEPDSPTSVASHNHFPSDTDTITSIEEQPQTPLMHNLKASLVHILDHNELQYFGHQIAKGMSHLESMCITHRDLAARNVLINEYRTLKISDFGLSRHGLYVNPTNRKLPIRWLALESIMEQKFNSKTDVWSFGVVLWEIATLGALPYNEFLDPLLIIDHLRMGSRLGRPETCTEETYNIMKRCWLADPAERPTFRELVDILDVDKRKLYVDFNQLNPTYVFPPSDLVKLGIDDVVQIKDGS